MTELTLESLARRVEALEKAIGAQSSSHPARGWQRVVGMFKDSEFMRAVDEECLRMRERERTAAQSKDPTDDLD